MILQMTFLMAGDNAHSPKILFYLYPVVFILKEFNVVSTVKAFTVPTVHGAILFIKTIHKLTPFYSSFAMSG